jgi:TolA-binding protein
MPIKINLLAEAQIAEDLRRRDPVKRAIYVGSFLVALALVWSSSIQLQVVINNSELNQIQASIQARSNEWQAVVDNQKKISDAQARLAALQQFSKARFLLGNFLNALQQLDFDGVQLAHVKLAQSSSSLPGSFATTSNGHTTPGQPATAAEKIVFTLDARDVSASPGDQVSKFKDVLANADYFKAMLIDTNSVQLTSLSSPQSGSDGKAFVLFTLECDLSHKIQ